MTIQPLVVVESPLSGDRRRNQYYAALCCRDCLNRGEFPYASHLMFDRDGLLDDDVPEERILGMRAGFAWGALAHKRVVYTDLGISRGMQCGINEAAKYGQEVEYRSLPHDLVWRYTSAFGSFPAPAGAKAQARPIEKCANSTFCQE